MAAGELLIGPFSDAAGRRPAVIAGLIVFVVGTILAATADSFAAVVFGRFLQGAGVAGPKIGTRAMIRDRYAGTDMAQVMSVIFTLLILVPMIAPVIGGCPLRQHLAGAAYSGLIWCWRPGSVAGYGPVTPRRCRRQEDTSAISALGTKHPDGAGSAPDVTPVIIATALSLVRQLTYFAVAAELFGAIYDLSTAMPAFFAILRDGKPVQRSF